MTKQLFEQISFFLFLIVLSLVVVLGLNFENIKLLRIDKLTIDSRDDYNLNSFESDSKITITGTPNNIFESNQIRENSEAYFFSLNEYIFDFIIISNEDAASSKTYLCSNVSETEKDLLNRLISEFNEPLELEKLIPETEELLSEESKDTITQNTIGQFGNTTKLLDCTLDKSRTDMEIYFLIGAEFLILTTCVVFLFRKRFINFIENLQDE